MPFMSLFGMSKLPDLYHIPDNGFKPDDKNEITGIATPFLTQPQNGFVIVTSIVNYLTKSVAE